ncbi:MAG: O-antigen ligase family protein [Oscillospiraceae bacterium]
MGNPDKQLIFFKHNEKTDFIRNLTPAGYQRMAGIFLLISAGLLTVCAVPYTVLCDTVQNYDRLGFAHFWSENFFVLMLAAVLCTGYLAYLLVLIRLLKKEFPFAKLKGTAFFAGYLVLAVVSTATAFNTKTAINGSSGRYEGLLTILAYAGLFFGCAMLTRADFKKRLCDFIVAAGAANAAYGILQGIPAFNGKIPSFYDYMLFSKTFMASGFTASPLALASLVTVCLGLSVTGFLHDGAKARKWFYAAASVVMVAAGILTHSLTAYVGITAVCVTIFIVELIRIVKKHAPERGGFFRRPMGKLVGIIASFAAVFGLLCATGLTALTDNRTVWMDSGSRLLITGGFDIDAGKFSIFPTLWGHAIDVIKEHPLTGAGPDNFKMEDTYNAYLQTLPAGQRSSVDRDESYYMTTTKATPDRGYSLLLDTAASSGIPAAVLLLAFIAATAVRAVKVVRKFYAGKDAAWMPTAAVCAALAWFVQSNINISTLTVTPFVMLTAALIWSLDAEQSTEKNAAAEKPRK